MKGKSLLILILMFSAALLYSEGITAELQDEYITAGETTYIEVRLSGRSTYQPEVPQVPGLSIEPSGQSSSVKIINGKQTVLYGFTYRVTASREGTYSIPPFTATINGKRVQSQSMILNVQKDSFEPVQDGDITISNKYSFMVLKAPEKKIYIGEAVPITVTGYFTADYTARISKNPSVDNAGFISSLAESQQPRERRLGGKKWHEVQWQMYLTPVKTGTGSVQVEYEAVFDIPMSSSRSFFSQTQPRIVPVLSDPLTITVHDLPEEGKPESFIGAIGEFTMKSQASPLEITEGDPITVKLEIMGQGNFSRIKVPVFSGSTTAWSVYPESESYTGRRNSEFQGIKKFEQVIAPRSSSEKFIPPFIFSYFNPVTEKYVELKTQETEILVAKGNNTVYTQPEEEEESFVPGPAPILHRKSSSSGNLTPVTQKTTFYLLPVLALSIFAAGIFIRIIQMRNSNAERQNRKKRSQALGDILKLMAEKESREEWNSATNSLKDYLILHQKEQGYAAESGIPEELTQIEELCDRVLYGRYSITKDEYLKLKNDIMEIYS